MERLNEERKRRFLMLEEKARLRCLPLVSDAKLMLGGHFLVERITVKKDSEMLVKCVCFASSFMEPCNTLWATSTGRPGAAGAGA